MLGEIIKERYQIVQILSGGGYCQTYLAKDLAQPQQTHCVIKHLLPANVHTNLSSLRRLFSREVAALEKLGAYPQVPQLLDSFEEQEQFYLVLEYIPGQPLSNLLLPGVRWNENQVIELLLEVLTILEVVHAHGLIHRDIKPSNLICREADGRYILIDFGSVKQAWQLVVTNQGQTNANYAIGIPATIAIGTPGYMPSEQSRGRPRPNSDIYALGMIGIQALTGMQPTLLLEDSETGEVIWQHFTSVNSDLAAILNQMIRYHFTERYQSATEVLTALQPLVAHSASSQESITSAPLASATSLTEDGRQGVELTRSTRRSRHSTSGVPPSEWRGQGSLDPSFSSTQRPFKTGNQNVALWLGVAVGVFSVFGLLMGIYYALRPEVRSVPPVPQSQAALAEPNLTLGDETFAQTLQGHRDAVWAIALGRDGNTLVSGSGDDTIKVWNLKTRQISQTLFGHSDTVRSVAISPEGKILASSSGDKTIKLWNLKTGKLLHTLSGHSGPVWSIAINHDGQILVSGSEDGSVKIWDLKTGELLRTLLAHSGRVFSVAVSPNEYVCASAGKDQSINIWNIQTGKLLRTLKGHTDAVRSLTFSPDGQKLASSSWDQTIQIWNWQTGDQLLTLKGHTSRVISLAFSQDGKTLASASTDRTIKIWEVQTGKLVRNLIGHTDWVLAVTTSPIDQTIVSSSKDQTIKIWQ